MWRQKLKYFLPCQTHILKWEGLAWAWQQHMERKFSTQKPRTSMPWKNPGEAWARTIRFLFVHYQHPPWSSVLIGKPPPMNLFCTCRRGFGWADKAQCFRSARRFGAAWFKSGLLRGFFILRHWASTTLAKKKNETAENHDVDRTLFNRVIPCSITNDRRPTHSHWTRFSPCTRDWAHRTAFSLRHDSRLSQFVWPG